MPIKQIVGIPGVPGAVGIWDDDPDAIAAHAALTTGPHDLGATWFSKYIARGITRSGIPTGQACWFMEDFADISRWQKDFGVASLLAILTTTGGVGEIAAGAGDTVRYLNGDATLGSPTVCKGDGRSYFAGCMCLPIAPAANGAAAFGTANIAVGHITAVGYAGTLDVAHFTGGTYVVGGAWEFASSTIAVDTDWHDFEFWCNGSGGYWFAVDGETPVAITVTVPPTAYLNPYFNVVGGGAGTTGRYDKYLCVFPQAA